MPPLNRLSELAVRNAGSLDTTAMVAASYFRCQRLEQRVGFFAIGSPANAMRLGSERVNWWGWHGHGSWLRGVTGRSGGRGTPDVVARLRSHIPNWKGSFQLAQTPKVWRALDEWLRHKLLAIQLKHWKCGSTMYRELLRMGAAPSAAICVRSFFRGERGGIRRGHIRRCHPLID